MQQSKWVSKKASIDIHQSPHSLSLQNFRLGDKYLIFEPIATLSYATLYHGVEEASMEQRVFKFYNFRELEELASFKEKQIVKRLNRFEWQIMRKCSSMNVVTSYGCYEDRDYRVQVYQYCQCTLKEEIDMRVHKKINQVKAVLMIKQIISGLKALFKVSDIYMPCIESSKILVRNGIYKISTLDLPRLGNEDEEDAKWQRYAPQILRQRSFDGKAMVWSVGLLFHEILYGQLPSFFQKGTKTGLINQSSQSLFYPAKKMTSSTASALEKAVQNFLMKSLEISPQLRMQWFQMQSHSMFTLLDSPRKFQPSILEGRDKAVKQMITEASVLKNQAVMSMIMPISDELAAEEGVQNGGGEADPSMQQLTNMGALRNKLKKQVQKQYERSGKYFEIQQIQKTSVNYLKSNINYRDLQTFIAIKRYYLQCLKVQFIYYNIVRPLAKHIEQPSRDIVELINLILGTCFSTMSQLNIYNKSQKQPSKKSYQSLLEACVAKSTKILYQVIRKKWEFWAQKLTMIENKFTSLIRDRFKKFTNKEKLQQKDKYLTGLQRVDFVRQDKIKYTAYFADELIDEIKKEVDNIKQQEISTEKNINPILKVSQLEEAIQYLQKYSKIWSLDIGAEIEERYPSLKEYIDTEMLHKKQK